MTPIDTGTFSVQVYEKVSCWQTQAIKWNISHGSLIIHKPGPPRSICRLDMHDYEQFNSHPGASSA